MSRVKRKPTFAYKKTVADQLHHNRNFECWFSRVKAHIYKAFGIYKTEHTVDCFNMMNTKLNEKYRPLSDFTV